MSDANNANERDFWSNTIKAYEPLQLPSPEITVKRLQKPPFRFIFDIVSAINARFSAYDHVIPEEFKDSSNVDTKEKKVEFLRILIDYVSKLLNVTLNVTPKKIISGHEPEKTNLFLQCLANACGYAQQDKAKTKQPNGGVSAEAGVQPPDDFSSLKETFQSQDMLPRKKKSSLTEKERNESFQQVITNSKAFAKKISGLSININANNQQSIKEVGGSIVRMWKELQNPQIEATPSPLTKEALEVAIKRQLDKLKQMQGLIKENDDIVNTLESFLV